MKMSKFTQSDFLQRFGIQKSYLTYHNYGSNVSEFIDIGMPYMIIYESLDTARDCLVTIEFTENIKNYISAPLTDFKDIKGSHPLHSHDFYELTIVLEGELKLRIENEVVTYHAGEACLCNKNIYHKEIFDTDFEIVLFMFKEEYIKSVLKNDISYDINGNSYIKETYFHHLFKQNQKIAFFSAKEYIDFRLNSNYDFDKFFDLINTLIQEIIENNSGKHYIIQGLFCRFIAFLSDEENYCIKSYQAKLSKEEDLLYQVSHLLETCNGRISRKDLEQQLNYNGDYINRIVKKHTGKTLSEYSRIFLLNEAVLMLENTDMKIGEICEALGYTNRSFFNRYFTERYGVPPSTYRKRS